MDKINLIIASILSNSILKFATLLIILCIFNFIRMKLLYIKVFKLKVKFFDWDIFNEFLLTVGTISGFITILATHPKTIDFIEKKITILDICYLLITVYGYLFINANFQPKISLKLNGNRVNIYFGDIFKQDGLKAIMFNEYFDTLVDDVVISKESLNGKYILEYYKDNLTELDEKIEKELINRNYRKVNFNRPKRKKYELGTTIKIDDFLLSAFSRFTPTNKAYLNEIDYTNFLRKFWREIDRLYNGNEIYITIMGSGITRMERHLDLDEYLEIIINSIKFSRLHLKNSSINIVIRKKDKAQVNLYKIKKRYGC